MKIVQSIAVLVIAVASFVACKKDHYADGGYKQSGSFIYSSTTIIKDTIIKDTITTDTVGYAPQSWGESYLILSEIDFANISNLTEKDTISYLIFTFGDTTGIKTGTFTYNGNEATFDATKNFSGGIMGLKYNLNSGAETREDVANGSIVISKENGFYTVKYDVTTSNNNKITGAYVGLIPRTNFQD